MYLISRTSISAGSTGAYYEEGVTERSSIESYDRELRHNVWNLTRKLAELSKDDGFDDISLHSTV